MNKLVEFLNNAKDRKLLIIGLLLLAIGLCLNPMYWASGYMTLDQFAEYKLLTPQQQSNYDLL